MHPAPLAAHPPSGVNVEFRTPWIQRLFDGLFALAICAIATTFGSVLAFLLLASSMPRSWSVRTMIGASGAVALTASLIALAVLRRRPSRILLDERTLRARGLLYRRTLAYEGVALVTVERPKNTVGGGCRIVARMHRGRPVSIWLSHDDAAECFDILRRMCEHAPAIDMEQGVLSPENPEHRRHGLMVAAEEFRRRARRNVLVFGFFALFSVSSISSIVLFYTGNTSSTRSITRRWISAVFFPLAAGGAALAWRNNRRFARELEDDAEHESWTVGFDEEE